MYRYLLPCTSYLCRADKLTHSSPWARRGGDSRHFILKIKLHWRSSDPSISSSSLWETRRDEHLNYFLGSTVRLRIYLGDSCRQVYKTYTHATILTRRMSVSYHRGEGLFAERQLSIAHIKNITFLYMLTFLVHYWWFWSCKLLKTLVWAILTLTLLGVITTQLAFATSYNVSDSIN